MYNLNSICNKSYDYKFYVVKSFSQDLSTNSTVRTTIRPAEPHNLLFAGQYSLPSADSQLPLLIYSFHC